MKRNNQISGPFGIPNRLIRHWLYIWYWYIETVKVNITRIDHVYNTLGEGRYRLVVKRDSFNDFLFSFFL